MAVVVEPMLAQLVPELPATGHVYEPKWDGFRCIVVGEGDEVRMVSRHGRPFARYFPELVEAFRRLPSRDCTLDGEIVVHTEHGSDFAALMTRLHPAASHAQRLSVETPARFMAFDLRVCEVAYDRLDVDRLRHPAMFLRWRPDRDPDSCTFDQLEPERDDLETPPGR